MSGKLKESNWQVLEKYLPRSLLPLPLFNILSSQSQSFTEKVGSDLYVTINGLSSSILRGSDILATPMKVYSMS